MNIPKGINKRLSNLSSNEEMFLGVATDYQEALKKSGYEFNLHFKPEKVTIKARKRPRYPNRLFWNPPYSMNVKSKIGATFFKLLDIHFPKESPLSKIVNRNTVKMAYRTTPNFKKIIASHNAKILKKETTDPPCNCRQKDTCPLNGQCRVNNLIYQATITTQQDPPVIQKYIGMTSTQFKDRLANHRKSFKTEKYKTETTLSQYIWTLKQENTSFDLKWKIMDRAKPFSPVTGVCALCTLEKYYIICHPDQATLNKNEEIFNSCRHKTHLLLDKT